MLKKKSEIHGSWAVNANMITLELWFGKFFFFLKKKKIRDVIVIFDKFKDVVKFLIHQYHTGDESSFKKTVS